ncbi:MAG TPA: SBBP repeat-containing protein [Thermoanaerobaculia bacterium]|jgi:hypothetical protein|nr:SBBP repeat-containing protein [Thermoanaerobaculia bacterium]
MKDRTKTAHGLVLATGIALMGAQGARGADFTILYSTFLGGSGTDEGSAIAVTPSGTAYVTGTTNSRDFPTSPGAFQRQPPAEPVYAGDAFVTKYNASGQVLYSTYFGGPNREESNGIAVGPDGSAYIVGTVFDLFDSSLARAFVAKISPSGQTLEWVRLVGGAYGRGWAIAVDPAGNAYVTGTGFNLSANPIYNEAFVEKLGPDGSFLYHTSLRGVLDQEGRSIAVDAAGNVYLAGITRSFDFPVKNALDTSLGGPQDAFVTRLDPSGAIVYSTFLGGSGVEEVGDLAIDPAGGVYVAGTTRSADFRATADALQPALQGAQDLFLVRLSPAGTLLYSTFLGGSGNVEEPQGLAVASSGRVYLGSTTDSFDSPLVDPEFDCRVGLVALLDLDSPRVVETACVLDAVVRDIDVDAAQTVFLTGWARDLEFPLVNAFQPVYGGSRDAFVTRLAFNRPPDCSAAFASPATLWPPNGRLVPVSIRNVTDPDGDLVTITVTAVRQDEPLTKPGVPDATGAGTSGVSLRADRDGKGDGRVYHLSFEARDPLGASCTGTVAVCVPHDQGRGRTCGDGGGLFDSL